jgi:SAM-dependent methyltransferase
MTRSDDARRHSPAAERNAPFIAAALQQHLPAHGRLLEVASGTGQHAAALSAALPGWHWQPSDLEAEALASITAWCEGLPQVAPPLRLDVLTPPASLTGPFDALYCANMVHIAPWPCTLALMQLAARLLTPEGRLCTYGPYLEDEVPTAPSNLAFDADLRQRNPAWGLRRLADVAGAARNAGLRLHERVPMPANNLLLLWGR